MKYFLIFALLFISVINTSNAASTNATIQISGSTYKGDTVTITLWDHYFGERKRMVLPHRLMKQFCETGTYHFKFDSIKGPVYFTLRISSGRKSIYMSNYLAMPGDSVHINQQDYKYLSFSGKGSEGMACRYLMDSITHKINGIINLRLKIYTMIKQKKYLLHLQSEFLRLDSCFAEKEKILAFYKPSLSNIQYGILWADVIGNAASSKLSAYSYTKSSISYAVDNDSLRITQSELYNYFKKETPTPDADLPLDILALAKDYIEALSSLVYQETKINAKINPIQIITNGYKGILRDHLLMVFLLDHKDSFPSIDSAMEASVKIIKTTYCKDVLQLYLSKYLRGITAYNFKLEDAYGKFVKLSDFRGKKVVIDYWYTGCSGCTQLYVGALKEVEKMYESDTSIVFISIANDADKKIWLESIKKDIYTSQTAVNLITGRPDVVHPAISRYGISLYPSMVIIDKNGKIILNQEPPFKKDELIAFIMTN